MELQRHTAKYLSKIFNLERELFNYPQTFPTGPCSISGNGQDINRLGFQSWVSQLSSLSFRFRIQIPPHFLGT